MKSITCKFSQQVFIARGASQPWLVAFYCLFRANMCPSDRIFFFPGGKSNYAQKKVLWNSISDSAVVSFQHILIWAHQRQHVISHNQLCLGVVKVGVWYDTSLCLGSNASISVMIHSGFSLVLWHSTAHCICPYSILSNTSQCCPRERLHALLYFWRIFVISFVSPPNRICNLGPVCPFLLLFSMSGYVLLKGTQL